ncbi:carboxylesterase [Stipitochalara longipes BDJ]|nr:carboxylesterase [Stipitochalara longipes BDJ]
MRNGLAVTLLASVAWASSSCRNETNNTNLKVSTRTGTFVGNLNDTYTDPPVGERRWTSPESLSNSSKVYDSTVFGPSCPQYVSAVPSVWALNITGNLIVNYGESLLAGLVAQNSAEDCLTLAIWTPASATPDSKLPVIHFLTGGGDVTGGINIPTQLPAQWVHRSQKHIVITTNYRVNIFGYPNARGLNGSTNFALQDQRKAVEWVSENIAAFGGDPSKITLWGQSAGSGATDMYLFAWYQEPIIRASISSSGVAIGRASNLDYQGTNFTFVAKSLGCDFCDPELELECMRRVPMARIENFVGQYQDNSTLVKTSQPAIAFTRQIDNKYVFSNYTGRYLNGQIAQLPKIIGTTAREASALVPYPVHNASVGPSEQLIVAQTLATVCAAYNTSILRNEVNLPTYRYEWAGNFTNIAPVSWLGAYHYSDLYMLFGSYGIAPGVITDLEVQTSEKMQDFFLDFVTDPNSLPGNGWPEYMVDQTGGGKLAQFGADGQVVQFVDGDAVEGACHIPGVAYNTTP